MGDTWMLLSDVHGNLPALERALEDGASRGASRIAFLGDLLGGPGDVDCCRLMMQQAELAVFGNREVRVRMPVPDDVAEWIRRLPATRTLDSALLCHSSPAGLFPPDITARDALVYRRGRSYWDLFPYVSGRESVRRAARALSDRGLSAAFFGHTHRQGAWRTVGEEAERLAGPELVLGESRTLVGLGAVGRGEKGRVEYALYVPSEQRVTLVSLEQALKGPTDDRLRSIRNGR